MVTSCPIFESPSSSHFCGLIKRVNSIDLEALSNDDYCFSLCWNNCQLHRAIACQKTQLAVTGYANEVNSSPTSETDAAFLQSVVQYRFVCIGLQGGAVHGLLEMVIGDFQDGSQVHHLLR